MTFIKGCLEKRNSNSYCRCRILETGTWVFSIWKGAIMNFYNLLKSNGDLVLSLIYSDHKQFRGKLSFTRWYYLQFIIKILWMWGYFAFITDYQKTMAQAVRRDFQWGRGLNSIVYSFLFLLIFKLKQSTNFLNGGPRQRNSNICALISSLKVRDLSFHQFWYKIEEEWLENRMLFYN